MRHGIADLVDQPAPQGGAGGHHRNRRGGGDLGGQFHCLGTHLVGRHQHVGQAHGVGFLAVDAPTGVEHQRGLLHADHARQRDSEAEAGVKAQAVEVGREARLLAGNAKVGDQREPQPAADGRAVHRGHHRLGAGEHARGLAVQRVDAARTVDDGIAAPVAEVGAGTERLALRTQHDGADIRVGFENLEAIGQLLHQLEVEEIVRGALDLDDRHVAFAGDGRFRADAGFAHARFSLCAYSEAKCLFVIDGQKPAARDSMAARPRRSAHHASAPLASRQDHRRRVA